MIVGEHIQKVLEGKSKRRVFPCQEDVATLFEFGYNCRTKTENFRSEEGFLWHYYTIEAIKTYKGTIISNRDCYSRGFARCTKPIYQYEINLSLLRQMLTHPLQMKTIEVLDDDEWAILFRVKHNQKWEYYLNARDNMWYVARLRKPCKTIKEAFESMIPDEVKRAMNQGRRVERQGELFFVESNEIPTSILVGRREKVEYGPRRYSIKFPLILFTRHTATRVGYTESSKCLVKGIVRHPEHGMLKLGWMTWFRAYRNIVDESVSEVGGD